VAEMRVHHDPEPLELLEISIDRRRVDVGREGPHLDQQLSGRVVCPATSAVRTRRAVVTREPHP